MSNNKDRQIRKRLKDIDNYTIDELKELLGLSRDSNAYTVNAINTHFIILANKYSKLERDGFLGKAKERILKDLNMNRNEEPNMIREQSEWLSKKHLSNSDSLKSLKLTDVNDEVNFYNDNTGNHEIMEQNNLNILNAHPLEIKQDTLNPILKNINQRFVVIDSQYRQNIAPFSNNVDAPSSSTDFTLDLSDPLTDTLSLKLYSYQIPYSWYVIDKEMGTSYFWVKYNSMVYSISIDDGNYNKSTLINAIQYKLDKLVNIDVPFNTNNLNISYNPVNGKACFLFNSATPSIDVEIIFYDTEKYNSYYDITTITPLGVQTGIGSITMKLNNNLGWILGYRLDDDKTLPIKFSRKVVSKVNYNLGVSIPYPYNLVNGIFSEGPIDTHGSKYLIIVLDDFNQNHLNSGLVNIVDNDTTLTVPDYFSLDLPNVCAPDPQLNGARVPFYVQSTPRKLTQAQMYSINQILDSRKTTYKYRTSGPTTTDVFAIVSIKKQSFESGDMIIDAGSTLMFNTRTYFGPVNISRMRVSLRDDKGNNVNLNGSDWSITLMAETLYKY